MNIPRKLGGGCILLTIITGTLVVAGHYTLTYDASSATAERVSTNLKDCTCSESIAHSRSAADGKETLAKSVDYFNAVFAKHQTQGEFLNVYPPIFAAHYADISTLSTKFALLEIGNNKGVTFRSYLEMFKEGDIYGLDLGDGDYATYKTQEIGNEFDNAHLTIGDQADPAVLKNLGQTAMSRNGGFDIIMDDGGHVMHQQRTSLLNLWKYVKPGGFYIIEDIETSYYESYGGGEVNKPDTFVALLKALVDVLQRDFHNGLNSPRRGTGTFSKFDGDDQILSVNFFTNACVIRKSVK